MAQEVHLMGATYSDVPSILLPDSNSTLHSFVDVTGTTATASDVASGKVFFASDGTQTTGTASGGSSTAADFLVALWEDSADLRQYTELPVSPTRIGSYEFYKKSNLALTSLPDSVTSIGTYAFYQCSSLAITAIPDGVPTIEAYAFRQCTSLTELTIPSSVTQIAAHAFNGNTGMTAYHMLGTTPPTLANKNAFNNIPSGCKIYVPTGCLSAYQSASNWSNYASYMEEE